VNVHDHMREANMTRGTSESIFSWGASSTPRCRRGTQTKTRMKRMRKTAATMTTASRPLLENQTKISCTSRNST
jgi:hypothetical protein